MRIRRASWTLALLLACDSKEAPKEAPPQREPEKPAPVVAEKPAGPARPKFPPGEPDEACARIVVVAWKGAQDAPPEVTRDQAAARARAEELQKKLSSGTDEFERVVAESDEPKTKAKAGAMGTFARDKWPEKYAALRDPVFALGIGETGPVVETPLGYVVARRCAVDKVHARHILVRYKGAKNAEPKIKRSKDDAQKLAAKVHADASKPGADFEALAKKHSEDGSAERGGDLGAVGRGMFAVPFEAAAWALKPGEVSAVVETDFGFHVIQRVE